MKFYVEKELDHEPVGVEVLGAFLRQKIHSFFGIFKTLTHLPRGRLCMLLFFLAIAAGGYSFYQGYVHGDFSQVQENRLVENMQVVFLALAFFAFLKRAFSKDVRFRAISAFLALLFYSLILREVDFERLGLNEGVAFAFHGIGRNVIAIVGFGAILLFAAIKDFNGYFRMANRYLFSRWSACMFLFFVILCLGALCEKQLPDGINQLYEEVFELFAYGGFMACAIDPLSLLNFTHKPT